MGNLDENGREEKVNVRMNEKGMDSGLAILVRETDHIKKEGKRIRNSDPVALAF